MTTKGKARLDARAEAIRQLPEVIARREADGHPVIVEWNVDDQGPLDEKAQRLYAVLGVLVRLTRNAPCDTVQPSPEGE